jgi:anti-sigma B factor antagonist
VPINVPPATLTITHHETALGTAVITVAGDLKIGSDCDRIPMLADELLRAGKRVIIFDIAGVNRLDSTGIGCFIASYNKIMAAKGDMRLAGTKTYLFRVFQVSSLDKVFRFYPTLEEAVAA